MTTQRGEAYRSFFQKLIDVLRENHKFTNARAGQPRNFYHFPSSVISGVSYDTFFAENGRVAASVLIDVKRGGKRDPEETRRLFDWLQQDQASIEAKFGSQLNWSKPDDVRACNIRVDRPGSIEADAANLQDIHAWLVANLLKLKEVFGPRLRAYNSADKAVPPSLPPASQTAS